MRRSLLLIPFAGLLLLLLMGTGGSGVVRAQDTPTATPTLTYQQSIALAKQSADDALNTSNSALGAVLNASSAVNTSNNALSIAIEAYVVGVVLIILIVILALTSSVRAIREARGDLSAGRRRLATMRESLRTNTEQVHQQAERAIRALAATQLGEQQFALGNMHGALRLYEKAYKLDPKNHTTHYFLGELYVQDRQFEAGISHIEMLLADMDFAPAQASLGQALYLQGDASSDPTTRGLLYAQAEARLLQAAQADPSTLDLRGTSIPAMLGALYKRQGRVDQALAAYSDARTITPESRSVIHNLALLYTINGQMTEAQPLAAQSERQTTAALLENPFDAPARADHLLDTLLCGQIDAARRDLNVLMAAPAPILVTLRADLLRLQQSMRLDSTLRAAIGQVLQETLDRLATVTVTTAS